MTIIEHLKEMKSFGETFTPLNEREAAKLELVNSLLKMFDTNPETEGKQPEAQTPGVGTITWLPDWDFPEKMGEDEFGQLVSDEVLVTDGSSVAKTKIIASKDKTKRTWHKFNLLPFTPTHWAYINYPETKQQSPGSNAPQKLNNEKENHNKRI
jgi:hypothetical protein